MTPINLALRGGKFALVRYLLIQPCLVNVRRLFAQRPTLRSAMSAFGLDPGTHREYRRLSGVKFARSRRSDLDAPFASKTRSFFWPTPPRQYHWLRTKASPTAPSLPLLTRENPPLRAFLR